jgi:hypothetical protein
MTKDEALDLALEALATEEYRLRQIGQSQVYPGIGFAITAIKQARSAPAQEPVAFNAGVPLLYPEMKDGETISVEYTTQPAAPVQEPAIKQGWDVDTLLDKPAAQRQWTGLTDEERNKIRFDYLDYDERARAIEAKLKEKNT